MNFPLDLLREKLKLATYDSSIGIKDVILEEITIQGKEVLQILLELDPGKELTPHLHEGDDEAGVILTSGTMFFGDAKKENGEYVRDDEGKIVVHWDKPRKYVSGETFTIPAHKAHHFVAGNTEPFLMLITLSKTHLTGEDRKFTTYP